MKKKILYRSIIAVLMIGCFFVGRISEYQKIKQNKVLNLQNDIDFDIANNFVGNIVDWNTDGTELSIMTQDGFELYAYKSGNIYE